MRLRERGSRNMHRTFPVFCMLLASAFAGGGQAQSRTQSQPAPPAGAQRTILTTPASVHSDADTTPASSKPDATDSALEKYREMWRKMTPAQQKAFIDSGGYTPEQYERLVKSKTESGAGGGDPQRRVDPAFDSLNKSLQNLDTIRDANLGRVQEQNCPPEVAARISDLKSRLRSYESGYDGAADPGAAPARAPANSNPPDPLAIATDWFKASQAPEPVISAEQQSKLLADVLPRAQAGPEKRQVGQQEIAGVKAELEQLSGACGAPAR